MAWPCNLFQLVECFEFFWANKANNYMYYRAGIWCLMPLSTRFQLYRGGQIYWWRKPEYPEKTTDIAASHWQTLSHNVYRVYLTWAGYKLTTLVTCTIVWVILKCKQEALMAESLCSSSGYQRFKLVDN